MTQRVVKKTFHNNSPNTDDKKQINIRFVTQCKNAETSVHILVALSHNLFHP